MRLAHYLRSTALPARSDPLWLVLPAQWQGALITLLQRFWSFPAKQKRVDGKPASSATRCPTGWTALTSRRPGALHHARPAADHEPAGWLLRDCSSEHHADQFERAADRKHLVIALLRVPFLDIELEAGQPVFACAIEQSTCA